MNTFKELNSAVGALANWFVSQELTTNEAAFIATKFVSHHLAIQPNPEEAIKLTQEIIGKETRQICTEREARRGCAGNGK